MTFLEGSYTSEDVPSFFWLVFDLEPTHVRGLKAAECLAQGSFPGLKGISDDKRVVLQWLDVARNALLVMPGEDVVRLNRLSRIDYSNPEYLVSKDFEVLYRIFNKEREGRSGRYGLMQNLVSYLGNNVRKHSEEYSDAFNDVVYRIHYGTLSAADFGRHYEETKPHIRNTYDFARYLKKAAKDLAVSERRYWLVEILDKVSVEEWRKGVIVALQHVAKIYQDEGEWLVKSDSFVVPPDSRLVVVCPEVCTSEMVRAYFRGGLEELYAVAEKTDIVRKRSDGSYTSPYYSWPHFVQLLQHIELYGLHKQYKISFIDRKKFNQIQKRLWAAKG